jgi:tetratricopeptide (TPR) repeat protein
VKYQIWTKYISTVAIVALVLPGGCSMKIPANFPTMMLMEAKSSQSNYTKYMLQGYDATKQRNYLAALNYFQQALEAKPGDTYATIAISNIQSYIERDRILGSKSRRNILYIPPNFDFGQPGRLIPAGTRTQKLPDNETVISLGNNNDQQSVQQSVQQPSAASSSINVNNRSRKFTPPARLGGIPRRRISAGSRGGNSCTSSNESIIALAPLEDPQITTSSSPTLFFYVPQTNAQALELVLQDENQEVISKATFKTPAKSGIVSVILANSTPEIKVGKTYRWFFSVVCDQKERSRDLVVQGSIVRLTPDKKLERDLASSNIRERANIYASSGSFTDALTNLAELIRQRPNDTELKTDWQDLLRSVNLGAITDAPLIECCKNQ